MHRLQVTLRDPLRNGLKTLSLQVSNVVGGRLIIGS